MNRSPVARDLEAFAVSREGAPARAVVCVALLLGGIAFAQTAGRAEQQITRAGAQASAAGPADFFTGRVRVDPVWQASETINTSGGIEPSVASCGHPVNSLASPRQGSQTVANERPPLLPLRPPCVSPESHLPAGGPEF